MRVIPDNALAVVTIYQEAQGEPFDGKVAVAEVIRNRMRKKYASDGTVAGTVLRPLQFSGWNAKDQHDPLNRARSRSLQIDDSDPIVADCVRAWVMAVHGGSDTVKGAVLYYNPAGVNGTPEWALPDSAIEVARIGRHVFFIPKIRGSEQV